MTELLNITPETKKEDTVVPPAAPAAKEPKTPRSRPTPPARTAEVEKPKVKWIRLDKGGTYGYKRAIYEQGKTYEVDLATAEHLLAQYYTLGNANETIDVYYFTEVKRK